MPDFTLDDIRAAADRRFGDLRIPDVATLRNALRLDKSTRRELGRLQERIDALQADEDAEDLSDERRAEIRTNKAAILRKVGDEGYDGDADEDESDALVRLVRDAVRLVASSRDDATRLLDAIGDDLPSLMEVFVKYGEVTQPGEAQPSES